MSAKDMREFADMQRNRGSAYSLLKAGDKQANLKRAITCYEKALQVYTLDSFTEEWASTQYELGNVYQDLPGGDRQTNLEKAIACYEKALQVYTPDSEVWAKVQLRLGDAYRDLPAGNQRANLEEALACYRKALQIYTLKDFPAKWALIQVLRGEVFSKMPVENQQTNLKGAITNYQSALQVYTRKAYPKEWAKTQHSLGDAYYNLRDEGRPFFGSAPPGGSPNLREAIFHYESALQVYTLDAFPEEWATTQYDLGNAYRDLSSGNRQTNLSNAIVCFQNILQVRTLENAPIEWAQTQHCLGDTYRALFEGDRQTDLEQAIASYERALQVYSQQDFPNDWSTLQTNLKAIKNEQDKGRLEEAEALRSAGDVQVSRGERTAAIESYRQALMIFRQTGRRGEEAGILCRIGDVQLAMDSRLRDAAMQNYAQALSIYQQVGDFRREADALRKMGNVDLAAAKESYQRASDLQQRMPGSPSISRLLATGDTHREAARQSYEQALNLFLSAGDNSRVDAIREAIADVKQLHERRDQVQRRLDEKEPTEEGNVRRAKEGMQQPHCRFCGAGLPAHSHFCGRCGMSTDVSALPTFSHSSDEEGRRRQPGLPLPGALAGEVQAPATNVPVVQGTPQVSGVPIVEGTQVPQHIHLSPTHLHHDASSALQPYATSPQAIAHHPAYRHVGVRYGRWLTVTVTSVVIIAGVIGGLAFFLPPGISLQGSHVVSLGGTLHLHGDGFLPGSIVTLTLDDRVPLTVSGRSTPAQTYHPGVGNATLLQVLMADQSTASGGAIQVGLSGTFDVAVPVSQSWSPGGHTIRATESVLSLNLQSVELAFMIEPQPAKLVVTPAGLDFGMLKKGSKATKTVMVSNTGQQPLNWTANVGTATWLTLDTTAGTLQPDAFHTIQVTIDTARLLPGNYPATLVISAGSERIQVGVTLVVVA